jgi:hypothetical protein
MTPLIPALVKLLISGIRRGRGGGGGGGGGGGAPADPNQKIRDYLDKQGRNAMTNPNSFSPRSAKPAKPYVFEGVPGPLSDR